MGGTRAISFWIERGTVVSFFAIHFSSLLSHNRNRTWGKTLQSKSQVTIGISTFYFCSSDIKSFFHSQGGIISNLESTIWWSISPFGCLRGSGQGPCFSPSRSSPIQGKIAFQRLYSPHKNYLFLFTVIGIVIELWINLRLPYTGLALEEPANPQAV